MFTASAACATPAASERPASAIAPLRLPPIAEQKLPNGLSVVAVKRGDLPLVAVRLVVPTGSARDPKGKEGLGAFTGELIRRGTESRSAEQIDDEIESLGGLLGVDVGVETTSIAVTVPSERLEQALEVIADLARRANFPQAEVDLARRRELSRLRHELDDPSSVADRAMVRFFYGREHPYGHPIDGSARSVGSFTRDDVVRFRDATYSPEGALLLLVGDIDANRAGALAKRLLGDWKGPKVAPVKVPPPRAPEGLEILLVDKPDATQAQVRATVPGLARRDPRFHAAVVANTIVGGGFTSRLVDEVRVNRGLSYSVGTRVIALREIGAISFSTFTKLDSVREILDVSLGVMDGFAQGGPEADELEKSKRYVAGVYPGRVESIDGLAEALAAARFAGVPFETVGTYREDIGRVSREQASAAASLWPSSTRARVVVVAPATTVRPQLEGLGRISVARAAEFE